jgi:predicted N-acetyltransferase YhbS
MIKYNSDNTKNAIKICSEKIQDRAAIAEVNNLAFGRDNEAKLIEKIRQSDRFIPELSLVAKLDNKLVGHILFSYIDLVNRETIRVLALAPIAVLPEYQNRGVGSLLIKTGLEIAEKNAAPMVIVLGEPKFYTRFGFQPAIAHNINSPFDVPDEYFMVKFSIKNIQDYQGKIIYPATFDDL